MGLLLLLLLFLALLHVFEVDIIIWALTDTYVSLSYVYTCLARSPLPLKYFFFLLFNLSIFFRSDNPNIRCLLFL